MSAGEAGRRQQRIAADEIRDNLLGFILAHDGVSVHEMGAALARSQKTVEKEVGRLKTLGYIDFFRNGNARRWMNAECAQAIQLERDRAAKIRQEKRLISAAAWASKRAENRAARTVEGNADCEYIGDRPFSRQTVPAANAPRYSGGLVNSVFALGCTA